MTNWNERFVKLAEHIGGWSKDTSVGVGAIIADDRHRVISIGYNGFPSGCNDSIEFRYDKPVKYLFTEHAERNAIYTAASLGVSTRECIMYLAWFPCADCARAIIQSGIKELVCKEPDLVGSTWSDSFRAAIEMLNESGVKITYIK
jgi:dCMP deaminase